ncbi:MDR family MFS transporter [Neptunicella sp.]|uniref:MDR family MFS transporter n=1 Tax=Neptunicella sp. TaxID=2125986 RepID=UPI003F694231
MFLTWLRHFPALIWILIIGVFFSRGTFFMVWPFMAIILYQQFGLNEWQIGLMLTVAATVAIFIGFYSGALTDKFGRKNMLLVAGLLSIVGFTLLAEAEHLYLYGISMILCSVSKEIWDPAAKALISDLLPQMDIREFALQVRYFAINVGAAIGPLVGVWLGITARQTTFYATALVFLILTLTVLWGFKARPGLDKQFIKNPFSLRKTLGLLARDQMFLLLVLANILVLYIYAHMDTSLIQYLNHAGMPEVVELISAIILTNALTIIIFQFILLKLLGRYSLNQRICFGILLLATGQFLLAINPINLYWGWITAIFVMSLGEAILFPTMNIQVDRLAPNHMKGAYFGAASLFSLGFAFAPYIGGLILKRWDGPTLFYSNLLLCLAVLLLYYLSKFAYRPHFSTQQGK